MSRTRTSWIFLPWRLRAACVCLLVGLLAGCVRTPPEATAATAVAIAPQPPSADAADRPALTLVPGDTIQVRFFYYPELNTEVTVRDDGRIALELLDDVVVEHLTPAELDQRLTELYTPHLRFPTLSVFVTSGPRQIYVGGEVDRPGAVELAPRMTVAQAIYAAGSFNDEADIRHVVLLRETAPGLRSYRIVDLGQVHRAEAPDPALEPFDVVFVPKSMIANLNLFVEQYIDNMIPFGRSLSYTYTEIVP